MTVVSDHRRFWLDNAEERLSSRIVVAGGRYGGRDIGTGIAI